MARSDVTLVQLGKVSLSLAVESLVLAQAVALVEVLAHETVTFNAVPLANVSAMINVSAL